MLALLVDTSAAMAAPIEVPPPYDPGREYLPDESATGCRRDRVYWRRGPGPAPSCGSGQWISLDAPDAARGWRCGAGRSALATAGVFVASRAAQWEPRAGGGYWRELRPSEDGAVECRADRGRHGEVAGDWYVADGAAEPWWADPAREPSWDAPPLSDAYVFFTGHYLGYLATTERVTSSRYAWLSQLVVQAARAAEGLELALVRPSHDGLGDDDEDLDVKGYGWAKHVAIKESVFPFSKFPHARHFLGPEMRSTGEVMGISDSFGVSFAKASIAAGNTLPDKGTVFVSLNEFDKNERAVNIVRAFVRLGFNIISTEGTSEFLNSRSIKNWPVLKASEGTLNIIDIFKNGWVQLIINTPLGQVSRQDEHAIGRAAYEYRIPFITTLSAAASAAIAEIMAYEDLGFCEKGHCGKYIEERRSYIGGGVAVNVDGGLKSKGHPIGATGVSMSCEIVKQLRGDCGERQVPNADVGLTHNVGGIGQYTFVHVYRRE